jgi:hypothetical protein
MERDTRYPDRLAPLQHITDEWASNLIELV